jgi:hypothetical protein
MNKNPLLLPSIALPQPPALYLPAPRFQIGQWVYWKALKDPDFGYIVGLVWAVEGSTKAIGYHYAVLLDKASFSSAFIDLDWAFEDDLAIMPAPHRL